MAGNGLTRSIRLENILSFGPEAQTLELGPLNVLIGPNGSGKSNLVQALSLLRAVPNNLDQFVLNNGGISGWIWKGSGEARIASISVAMNDPSWKFSGYGTVGYGLSLAEPPWGQNPVIVDEAVWGADDYLDQGTEWQPLYRRNNGDPIVSAIRSLLPAMRREDVTLEKSTAPDDNKFSVIRSVLSQLADMNTYPEISFLRLRLDGIQAYDVFDTGPGSALRQAELAANLPGPLDQKGSNLHTLLNSLLNNAKIRDAVKDRVKDLYEGIKDVDTQVAANTLQTIIFEDGLDSPITPNRMSGGTLRYLCLIAILCNPNPPPLILLEEPEVGLHPDLLQNVTRMIKEASERTQLIVTTHSEYIVDYLNDQPESLIITERGRNGTEFKRVDKENFGIWLEKYRVGELWTSGQLGGVRW